MGTRPQGACPRFCSDEMRSISSESRYGELALQVPEVGLGIDGPADGSLERLCRQELPSVPVEVLAQPLADRTELAAPDLLVDVVDVGAQAVEDLNADHVAERVRRKVTEAATAPMDVLQ